MKDRNEWFEEVERAYSKLKIVERPYAPPYAAVAVEAEDVLCCLGLHPHISASDWLVINLDEVSELIELIRPVSVTGATSDGYHTFETPSSASAPCGTSCRRRPRRRGARNE